MFDDRCFHTGDIEGEGLEIIEQQQAEEAGKEQAVDGEEKPVSDIDKNVETETTTGSESENGMYNGMEKAELNRMGIKTAFAIAFHNFPEGLATFVSYTSDPWAGVSLAIASKFFFGLSRFYLHVRFTNTHHLCSSLFNIQTVAFHNIPEGLCVALPIYYSSGSRWKGFGYAALSALSEPLGAFFGWIVLAAAMTETAYAVLFATVGGMMVMISITELLPTAYKYDPSGKIVAYSFLFGMMFMSISLVLLQF